MRAHSQAYHSIKSCCHSQATWPCAPTQAGVPGGALGAGCRQHSQATHRLYLHSPPFSPLFFPGNLLLAFLSLFPLSVLVFVVIVPVFEEAGVVPRAAGGELGDFAPAHFEDQLQGLLHILLKDKEKGSTLKEGPSGQEPQRGAAAGRSEGQRAPGGAGHAGGAPRSTC